jgi:bacterioferritin-associated ferredoxin
MYVCICNAVTDSAIRQAVAEGANSFCEVSVRTGCGTQCGSCIELAREVMDEVRSQPGLPTPLFELRVVTS